MRKIFLVLGILAAGAARAESGDLYTAVRGDTVYLFMRNIPQAGQVYHVERQGPGDSAPVRLTSNPLRSAVSGNQISVMLGRHYSEIQSQLGAASPDQVLLRLRADAFTSMIYSMLYHPVGTALGRFFKAGGHKSGETYSYRVIRMDRDGEVLETLEASVKIRENPPAPPQNVRARLSGPGVAVEWDYPRWKPNTGDLTAQFILYRKDSKGEYRRIHDKILLRLDGLSYFYAEPLVQQGQTYTYAMRAVDGVGLQSALVETVPLKIRDVVPPSAPNGLAAQEDPEGVRLVWNQSAELDVVYYRIYRWEGASEDSVRIDKEPVSYEDPAFVDGSAKIGVQYFYAVSAVDREGNEGNHSSRISVFPTDRIPPGKCTDLSASLDKDGVLLSWKRPADPDLWGFRVSRGYNETSQYVLSEKPGLETRYLDKGGETAPLRPGGKYYYTVKALDTLRQAGESVGVWIAIPDNEPPAPPGAVLVDREGDRVRIRWNPSPSLDVVSYRIYRIQGDRQTEMRQPKGSLFLLDTDVQKGVSYTYSITALDTAGNESAPTRSAPYQVRDFSAPPKPRFAAAQALEKGVRIYWERVVDFDLAGYHVYRSNQATGIFERITGSPVNVLEFIDPSGKPGFWYKVRAVDTSGNESDPGEAVEAKQ